MAEGKRVVRQYPVEFKIDAVELVEKKGYPVELDERRYHRGGEKSGHFRVEHPQVA